MAIQLSLFEKSYAQFYQEGGLKFSTPEISDVTFKNGLEEPVHRWFRLTPSYSPELVRYLFEYLNCGKSTTVCDPFLGKGTTAIEGQKLGIPVVGVEINPLLKLVSEYSLAWDIEPKEFTLFCDDLLKKIALEIDIYQQRSIDDFSADTGIEIPKIHNVFRWWKPDVLRDLLVIRKNVFLVEPTTIKKLLWVALSNTVLDCANIHRKHPTITFDDDHDRDINPLQTFREKIADVTSDLFSLPERSSWVAANVVLGDSTKISDYINMPIDRVITSPPYPNRFSYVHTTRPQLFFMGLLETAREATDIDLAAIGGTWGRATSILQNGPLYANKDIQEILADFIPELRAKHPLLCNYAIKYFNMMDEHIAQLRKIVSPGFRGAYVVGNSRLSGVEIRTDILLSRIFEIRGFNVDNILVLRRRGGKKRLYETAVCVSLNS